jgi:4-carboxymuconolactone decarboxylase
MANYPIDEWERAAAEVRSRLAATSVKPRFEGNPMAELAPEFAALVQTVARGRCYANPTIDLKTRALLTVACLVGLGEQSYIETWIANAMTAGATREEIVELVLQLFTYVGTPKTVTGFAAAKAVFDEST